MGHLEGIIPDYVVGEEFLSHDSIILIFSPRGKINGGAAGA
jgi:hypothetical protein